MMQQEEKQPVEGGISIRRDDYGRSAVQPREMIQSASGGRQVGGSITESDIAAGGGSSGKEDYRCSADRQFGHQGRKAGSSRMEHPVTSLSRGEQYDEEQGGGRGPDSVE